MTANIMERCCSSGSAFAAEKAVEAAEAANKAAESVTRAYEVAEEALEVANKAAEILKLTTTAHNVETGGEATAVYIPLTNTISFGLPKGDKGEKGDTGLQGRPGNTPYIQDNTWWIGGLDTGIPLAIYEEPPAPAPIPNTTLDGGYPQSIYLANQILDCGTPQGASI